MTFIVVINNDQLFASKCCDYNGFTMRIFTLKVHCVLNVINMNRAYTIAYNQTNKTSEDVHNCVCWVLIAEMI